MRRFCGLLRKRLERRRHKATVWLTSAQKLRCINSLGISSAAISSSPRVINRSREPSSTFEYNPPSAEMRSMIEETEDCAIELEWIVETRSVLMAESGTSKQNLSKDCSTVWHVTGMNLE